MPHLTKIVTTFWIDPVTGKRVKPGTPNAKKKALKSRKWYGKAIPGYPPNKAFPLASDKSVATQMLAELVRNAERELIGQSREELDLQKAPLTQHLSDFVEYLRSKDVTEKHVRLTRTRVEKILVGCGFQFSREVNKDKVLSWLAKERQKDNISNQTSNYYLTAFKHFCSWMHNARPQRIADNPLPGALPVNAELDRQHLRRELTAFELVTLLDAVRCNAKVFRRLTGIDRYHLYLTACTTGYRAEELAKLTPAHFAEKGDILHVTHPARDTKKRRQAAQPLPRGVAGALQEYFKDKPREARIWSGSWWQVGAKMLRRDLALVDIPYVVEIEGEKRFADFHALRHTYITLLGRSGLSPKEVQALARHSTITLTLGLYTHLERSALGEAIQKLDLPIAGGNLPPYSLQHWPREQVEWLALWGGMFALLFAVALGITGNETSTPQKTTPKDTK